MSEVEASGVHQINTGSKLGASAGSEATQQISPSISSLAAAHCMLTLHCMLTQIFVGVGVSGSCQSEASIV